MTTTRVGLIVTGRCEAEALDAPFNRAFAPRAACVFQVFARIGQLRPRKSPAPRLPEQASGKRLPTRDEELGLRALGFLRSNPDSFVLVVDDLEGDELPPVFERYRKALDGVLAGRGMQDRAAVHFLKNMVEAYFFAHADAVNRVAQREVLPGDEDADVELMRHPKGKLSDLWAAYSETQHGGEILRALDLHHILSTPDRCCCLRSAVAWCVDRLAGRKAFYAPLDPADFCLDTGCKVDTTYKQQLP
jgi:hypothetical protein